MNKYLILLLMIVNCVLLFSKSKTDANIFGDVKSNGKHLPGVTIYVKNTKIGTFTDKTGHFSLVNLPEGENTVVARFIGYKSSEKKIMMEKNKLVELNFELEEEPIGLGEVVVTGTRTEKRNIESPIIVNTIDKAKLESLHANSVSEGLCYQPGLRLETDCQTCNYTQLRMNGLGGAYSQILINGKSLFSPILGLYGLEQISSNMIERIEVVRGGGSALYGPFAVGGVVNLITKFPGENLYDVTCDYSNINNNSTESILNAGVSLFSDSRKEAVSFFATKRTRDAYDHNGDGFSEMPKLEINSFGMNLYYRPDYMHSIEANVSSVYEYRRGGDKIDFPAHEAEQSEERSHNIFFGSIDYIYYYDDFKSSLKVYSGFQNIYRRHYTGIIPDIINQDSTKYVSHFMNPPYGTTKNQVSLLGFQLNQNLNTLFGEITSSFGAEYLHDEIKDEIDTYNYQINQTTKDLGTFLQLDWDIDSGLNLLLGIRADKHNYVKEIVINPRIAVLYNIFDNTQLRLTYSTGFRPPQAFDTDIHIAFAGGGIQKIILSENLKKETSQSVSTSINFDFPSEHFIYGFTLDGFYTQLSDVFILEEIDRDIQGNSILEKRNGDKASVYGTTLEARFNYERQFQMEAGYTLQKSIYNKPIFWSKNLKGETDYMRTPDSYGYLTLSYSTGLPIKASLSCIYTGQMRVPHYVSINMVGNPQNDILHISHSFFDIGGRISYKLPFDLSDLTIVLYTGIQNLLNSYQNDFDKGKYRDSNYIYGPSKPRTIYLGIKLE